MIDLTKGIETMTGNTLWAKIIISIFWICQFPPVCLKKVTIKKVGLNAIKF